MTGSALKGSRWGFGLAVLVSMAVAALVSILLASGSAGAATARDRTVTDMPDDISGSQVHFLYVVPSDGTDGQLDINGAMEQSIARIQRWLVTQTGNQGLQVDTYNGAPDITFVRLPHSDAQATSTNPWPIWVIGEDLVAAGFNDPAKVYAAFYGGHSTWACGGSKSPALPKLAAMYLQAWPTNDPRPCVDAPGFGTGTDHPGYFEIGLLHEVMHTIGFAPSCAPHVTELDHVDDNPADILYHPDVKSSAAWDWSHAVLDFNRDDYYRAHISGCPDLSDSPYLAPMHSVSVTVSGPGAVTSSPAGILCPDTCAGSFKGVVKLTAMPVAGAVFAGWTGACSGTEDCVVAMDADKAVAATFTKKKYSLTVAMNGDGGGAVSSSPAGIGCVPTCAYDFASGTVVTLTPSPAANSAFDHWSGACSGTGSCAVTVDSAKSVTATFVKRRWALSVETAGEGSGTVIGPGIDCGPSCSNTYADGTVVTLTTASNFDSRFAGWSGPCSGTGACTVTMDAAKNVVATFNLARSKLAPCVVPNVKGKALGAAKTAISRRHCRLGSVTKTYSSKVKIGRVISQNPAAGKHLKNGAKVKLTLSRGRHR